MLTKRAFLLISLIFSLNQNLNSISYEKTTNIISSLLLAGIPAYIAKKISKPLDYVKNESRSPDLNYQITDYIKQPSKYISGFTYFISFNLIYDRIFLPRSLETTWIDTKTKILKESELLKRLPLFIKKSEESLIEEIKEYYIDKKLPLAHAVNTLIDLKINSLKAISLNNLFREKIDNSQYKITKSYRKKAFGDLLNESKDFVEQFNQDYFDNINKIILCIKKTKEYLKEVKIDNDIVISSNQKNLLDQVKSIRNLTIISPVIFFISASMLAEISKLFQKKNINQGNI